MERPKQPNIIKRHRNRGMGEKRPKAETREVRQNFWRHASGPTYLDTPKGKMLHAQKEKRRAKNKRSRAARKRNR